MASELCSSLRLKDKDLSGKLLQVVEEHGASSTFVIASLMWNATRTSTSICLVALQNSSTHYQNVAKKLGFNLTAVDNKTVVLDPVWEKSLTEPTNLELSRLDGTLYEDVKTALASMSGKKCLIVDDLSVLITAGVDLAGVVSLLQCLRQLMEDDKDLSLLVCSHVSENCEDHRLLADFTSHVADLRVTVAPLRTGFSTNVTGSLEVVDNLEPIFGSASDKKVFHFKLTDRQIKVFAPGTVGVFGR
ncbi:elongator complex protein 6-like [Macrosteles quadrilineatus]|uniref:elongator complex protein 6-like n=1 Tax=Macrosteles quadrilineatus TaxID=74068 RepID=UPI0023E117F6|nr:elongator complex protein 6-like [Macrosteles quadrilineatus]